MQCVRQTQRSMRVVLNSSLTHGIFRGPAICCTSGLLPFLLRLRFLFSLCSASKQLDDMISSSTTAPSLPLSLLFPPFLLPSFSRPRSPHSPLLLFPSLFPAHPPTPLPFPFPFPPLPFPSPSPSFSFLKATSFSHDSFVFILPQVSSGFVSDAAKQTKVFAKQIWSADTYGRAPGRPATKCEGARSRRVTKRDGCLGKFSPQVHRRLQHVEAAASK